LHGWGVRAVRFGHGNTDAGFVLGTGKLWLKVPPTMKFAFRGEIPSYLTAKDLILAVIGEIGVDGATYRSMYFAGDGISSLTLEDRMTLTNMAIEAGGKNGVCDVDEKTLQYVRARSNRPDWEVSKTIPARLTFSKGVGPEHDGAAGRQAALADNRDTAYNCRDVKLDQAYIGSCTGGKITDMIFAANILKGNQVKYRRRWCRGARSSCRHEAPELARAPREGNEKSIGMCSWMPAATCLPAVVAPVWVAGGYVWAVDEAGVCISTTKS